MVLANHVSLVSSRSTCITGLRMVMKGQVENQARGNNHACNG